ncbi:MAG: TonB-dependent receptor, partial [Bryobacteraceae bacterium]
MFPQATAVVEISGVVTDPAGSSVPGAEVKAVQTATGLVRTATTEANGSYALSSLPVGPYRLEVSKAGFKSYVQQGIVLQVSMNPVVNVALQVGTLTQEVDVSANAAMVETQTTGVSQVIDQRRVVDLPLNGRQPTELILLSGAAVAAPPSDVASSKNYPSSTTISVAGGQANGTYYLMDGGDHIDWFGTINLPLPFPDALQEFSVETSTVPASFGVRGGAVVNAVTKSGTNELHGDLFEFLRNGDTNARNFFAAVADPLKRNQFGGVVGGPIVRNKLFFFAGYQGTRISTAPPTRTVFLPTSDVLAGNFSTLESSACGKPRTLTDPATGAPFPGNFIPPSRFNAQSLALLKYLPTTADACGKLLMAIPDPQHEDQVIGRVDWIKSERHSIFGRYFIANYREPGVFNNNLLLTNRAGLLDQAQSVVFGDTFTLGGGAINSIHGTFTRKRVTRGPAPGVPPASAIGLQIADSPGNFPDINVSSHFETFCGTCSHANVNNNTFQFADDVSLIRGRHQFGFGVDWIQSRLDFLVTTQQDGSYSFDGSVTNDQLADFLLGTPANFVQGNPTRTNPVMNYFGLYAQDHFRVNAHMTWIAGVRWEPYFPEHDLDGRATHFDPAAFAAGRQTRVFQNAPPGMFFPGDSGIPDAGTNRHLANFAPRVGLIWDPTGGGRMTVRASYGLFYDLPDMQYFDRFGFGPPWASTITITSPVGGFTNPYLGFPGGNPFPQPSPPKSDAFFPPGGQFATLPIDLRPTYMQQWNLTVERQVGADWLFSASYLGNKSSHRWVNRQIDPAVYIPSVCGGRPCSTTGNTTARRLLTAINPAGGALISSLIQADDGANAEYNALKISANHRLSENFSLLVNYTWSHCISEG